MGDEFKKYDSEDNYECLGVRLAKDAEVRDGANDTQMVRLTFVSTSRNEADSDLWVEANVADRQADLAAFLKKGDILHQVKGKPCIRKYGTPEKTAFSIRRASLVVPLDMFKVLKERGWTPGAKAANTNTKPTGKTQTRKTAPREMPNLDDDIPF